jgi:hypothetical protein
MKKIVHFSLFAALIVLISSCAKQVDIIVQPAYDPMPGNWYISDAVDYDGNTWAHFDPGLYGTFNLYNNGVAEYSDNNLYLQGTWNTTESYNAYYDYNGNYRSDHHETFSLYATDPAGHSVHLYFDDIVFSGNNQFVATYYDGSSLQVITFSRGN